MECYLPARHENQIRCVSTATSTSIRTISEICEVCFAIAACTISEGIGFVCFNRRLFLSSMFASEKNLQFQFSRQTIPRTIPRKTLAIPRKVLFAFVAWEQRWAWVVICTRSILTMSLVCEELSACAAWKTLVVVCALLFAYAAWVQENVDGSFH